MAPASTTPTRRLTRSQTATSVLGKRTSLSRSSSVVSNKTVDMLTPEPTPNAKRSRKTIEEFDSRANKENVPPMRDLLLDTPSTSRLSRRSSFSSDISSISTPSRNNLRRSVTQAVLPQTPSTPSSALDNLSLLATPPSTPSFTLPLYIRVRGLLRATSNSSHLMSMDGRSNERSTIESFLHSLDADSTVAESVLYVSGSPGTGKTALVNSIIASATVAKDVKIVFVNCMGITGMDALWQKLAEELAVASAKGKTGKRGAAKKVQGKDEVCTLLEKQRDLKCILVLDELDNLAGSSSNALQPLFALTASYPSTIRIMGIANTHTLTSTSSIIPMSLDSNPSKLEVSDSKPQPKIKTIHFAPYGPSELLAILNKRFEHLPQDELRKLLPAPALMLLTKKVSGLTGDVRVLFEVLRGAIDNAVPSSSSLDPSSPFSGPSSEVTAKASVSPAHILAALKSYTPTSSPTKSSSGTGASCNSEIVTKVRGLGLQQRLVLLALVLSSKRTAASLPLSGPASSSSVKTQAPASPTKRPRSPIKRTSSNNAAAFNVGDGAPSTVTDVSQLYTFYTTLLATADVFSAVSRSEFTDLLGILETTGLVAYSTSAQRGCGFKRASSFSGSGSGSGAAKAKAKGAQTVGLQAHVREGEVVRGLGIGANAESTGDGDALEDAVRAIWAREMCRIRREAKAKDALAMLEGIEGFEDATED